MKWQLIKMTDEEKILKILITLDNIREVLNLASKVIKEVEERQLDFHKAIESRVKRIEEKVGINA